MRLSIDFSRTEGCDITTNVTKGPVSDAVAPAHIQRTPENTPDKRGAYGTWAVFSVALAVLLGLMLVPSVTALRRSEEIYKEIRKSQEQFQTTQTVLTTLSQNVFTVSITVREFLLDNSPQAGRVYGSRLRTTREQLQASIDRLRQLLPSDEVAVLQQLQHEVDAYLELVLTVTDWNPDQRAARGAYFLREDQRPRRETILAAADRLADLNSSVYDDQQRRTIDSENRFRRDLQQSVLFALLAGIAVTLAGILRMRWLERRAREQHQRAEQTSEELRHLSMRLRQVQEDERRTISRELHDEVGQKLTAMRMELGGLERLRTGAAADFSAALSEVKELAEQSLRMIRDIAAGLRPSVLDDFGLGAALQKQAREFSKRTGTIVSVDAEGTFARLGDRERTSVYRIVQEALTNCAKHAHAHRIAITLVDRSSEAELTVTDDGEGFDHAIAVHSGLGLIGIEERVRELSGTVNVRSARGKGTTISVTIPQQ
jgi:signal transduction histidine kinase